MLRRKHTNLLVTIAFLLATAAASGSASAGAKTAATGPANAKAAPLPEDVAREQRWAKQLTGDLAVGQAQWLTANGHRFLTLYTPQTAAARKGAVILLPGLGAHPDWPGIIHTLRVRLPHDGWSTLSEQMPMLPSGSPATDYAPLFDVAAARIQAGIDFLHKHGVKHIVLAGHGLGAAMGAWYLAGHANAGVETFVGIGMSASASQPRLDTPTQLARIQIPVLDLFGSMDLEGVVGSAGARAAAARRAGNTRYRQQEVVGADHFFDGLEDEMLLDIRGWLRHVAGKPAQHP